MSKKIRLFCFFLCLSFKLLSQSNSFQFGVKTGIDITSAFLGDVYYSSKFKNGYHVGVTIDYLLPQNFLLQSGLFFSSKGSEIDNLNNLDYIGGTPEYTHTFNESYLELPIRVAYRFSVAEELNMVVGLGSYFGYGVGGKTKQRLHNGFWGDGVTEHEWNTFGNGVFDRELDYLHGETLKKFDFGGSTNVDLEYRKFILGIGYNASIINIASKREFSPMKYRNSDIRISFGYKL